MSRRFAPATLLVLAFASPVAHAQVNIDQDKTPAHIFASDCSVCHKSTRGLASGRGSGDLTGFLVEHYTSSREEAAAMAAYVLAVGGGVAAPAPARGQNSAAGRAPAEAPKGADARRTATKPAAGEDPNKPRRTVVERGKPPREQRSATTEPASAGTEPKPQGERREPNAAARRRGRIKPAEAAPPHPETATVAAEAKPAEVKPAAAAPSVAPAPDGGPSAASPAARDNIPD